MENQNYPSVQPPSFSSSAQQYKRSRIVFILWAVVLAGTILTLTYLWIKERNNSERLNNQVSSLNQQVSTLNSKVEKLDSPDSKPQADKQQVQTVYKATVGKFTLTLPAEYAIIKEHDGPGEGGSSTELLVGKKTKDAGVVESESYGRVEIRAVSGTTIKTQDEWIKSSLEKHGGEAKKQPPVAVDGVTAQAYRVSGLFSNKHVYFTKGGIFYEIVLINDDTPDRLALLDTVIKGFKFN